MATDQEGLPEVLLFMKPPAFVLVGEQPFTSDKFRYLKVYESPLPLDQFLLTHAQSVQAILSSGGAPVTADILRLLPAVRVVVTTSAGLNQIDLPECRRRGIKVANTGDTYSADVADMAVGLLIDVMRKISASDGYVRQRRWSTEGDFPLASKVNTKSMFHLQRLPHSSQDPNF
uniref:Glycerate dehydrogenase n=1 Tax=Rhizophora mucronata TaxID=61149 RepID=A0A2P2J7Z9_RHIMU